MTLRYGMYAKRHPLTGAGHYDFSGRDRPKTGAMVVIGEESAVCPDRWLQAREGARRLGTRVRRESRAGRSRKSTPCY